MAAAAGFSDCTRRFRPSEGLTWARKHHDQMVCVGMPCRERALLKC